MKAIIYCRFSPKPKAQAERSESIEGQAMLCQEYCDRQGHEVQAVFFDRSRSGGDDGMTGEDWANELDEERPGLWGALNALGRGYRLVVMWQSRLARGMYLAEFIRRFVARAGGTIEVVSGSVNGEAPEQVLLRQMLQAFDEYERKVIAARTRTLMRAYQASGRRMSDKTPFGWRPGENQSVTSTNGEERAIRTIEEDPDEQATIRDIVRLEAAGVGLRAICRDLEGRGVLCRGHKWHPGQIRRILDRAQSSRAQESIA